MTQEDVSRRLHVAARRLRIAVLSRNFSNTGGGAERYAIALVEQLAVQHEVHVFAQQVGHAHPAVTYHYIPTPMARPRWINQLYFAYATWRATRQGFDIVHSHENTWHGNVQTVHVLPIKHNLFAGKVGWAKVMRWLKVATSPRLLAYLWLERQRYRTGGRRRIVLASDALREVMLQQYPHTKGALEVAAPGVTSAPGRCDGTRRQASRVALGLPTTGYGLLFVGNDFVKKGLPALLRALQTLPTNVWLAVVGQGDQSAQMRQLADTLGLRERVLFLGAQQEMGRVYDAADALVHPTLEDTYAMVVLEAFAHGVPAIVSGAAYCGISRELEHGKQAHLLNDPHSVADIASAVQGLVSDPELALRLSQQGYAFAATRTWQKVGQAYAGQYVAAAPLYRQRWLVLAHAFNMDGRAASQTITDKLPYLEQAGIEVVVLSGVSGRKDTHYEHHQLWPAGPAGIRFELRHVLRKRLGSAVAYRSVMVLLSLPLLPFMLLEKLWRPVESAWSWWLTAFAYGWWLTQRRKFDWIYSTGGAFGAHVAGHALKKATGIAWLAEVHDPMVVPGAAPRTAQQKMQARIERTICTHANVAIWFTDQALASAKQRHPQLGDRGKMMLPGVDAPFDVLPPYVPGLKMVIGHFGSLSATRNLTPILAALEALVAQRPELRAQIELQVTGGPLDAVTQAYLAQSAVQGMVRHLGRIEADPVTGRSGREQILRRMRSADVLLLLHGSEPICAEYIPSKMYEYLWMQRPILALVHGNAQMAALLRGQGHIVVDSSESDNGAVGLTHALEQLHGRWCQTGLIDRAGVSPYTTQAAVASLLSWT